MLDSGQTDYREVGNFRGDAEAKSVLIEGFAVKPKDTWAAAQAD